MPFDLFFIEHNIDDTSREIAGAKKNEFGTSTGKYDNMVIIITFRLCHYRQMQNIRSSYYILPVDQ